MKCVNTYKENGIETSKDHVSVAQVSTPHCLRTCPD